MKWVSALSTRPSLEAAVKEVAEQALQSLEGHSPDFGMVFISSTFMSEYARLMPLLEEYFPETVIAGCSGGGIVGSDSDGHSQEIEGRTALSLSLARLPQVDIHPFHIQTRQLPDLDGPPDSWVNLVGISPHQNPQFIILADPMSGGINDVLQGLDFAYPGSVKIGGLASMGGLSGQSSLFLNGRDYRDGIIGVGLSGRIALEPIVAQGCRPIGEVYRVVEGDRNIILQLAEEPSGISTGKPQTPLEALQSVIQDLEPHDLELAQNSLFVGVAQSEFKENLEHGDFLIRNLLGVDPKIGALAIGERVRAGQRIQFHLRDAQTSEEDLSALLESYAQKQTTEAMGALMFSCLGRGEMLYKEPNFDSGVLHRYLKNIPINGFFCNGEIGPVGGNTFIHGYTSVFGIVRQP
ncbi:MAG: FIST N-terminal domain-containing protein [Leptolyngbyaceae bacterium]|nr:FIST N-terminal domain-containing protein [Leptolyngbyaceae bacterium]